MSPMRSHCCGGCRPTASCQLAFSHQHKARWVQQWQRQWQHQQQSALARTASALAAHLQQQQQLEDSLLLLRPLLTLQLLLQLEML